MCISPTFSFYAAVRQAYEQVSSSAFATAGNDALLRCELPSHAVDMVVVVGWTDSDGGEHLAGPPYG